jgi:oligopeptide/dipeptide ABC transporter ATP-binding protein
MSILLITHDLGVVAETAHHVAVMYAGRIVEEADVQELFDNPLHPYTVGLFRSRPSLEYRGPLTAIPGQVPSPLSIPGGCPFHPRCPLADGAKCSTTRPPLVAHPPSGVPTSPSGAAGLHSAACWYSDRVAEARTRQESLYK